MVNDLVIRFVKLKNTRQMVTALRKMSCTTGLTSSSSQCRISFSLCSDISGICTFDRHNACQLHVQMHLTNETANSLQLS